MGPSSSSLEAHPDGELAAHLAAAAIGGDAGARVVLGGKALPEVMYGYGTRSSFLEVRKKAGSRGRLPSLPLGSPLDRFSAQPLLLRPLQLRIDGSTHTAPSDNHSVPRIRLPE